jgi:hypothetical protein
MVSSSPLRKEASDGSEMVSQVLFGEPVNVLQIQENWIEIETYFDGYHGWMDVKHVLAISEKEMRIWLDKLRFAPITVKEILTPWGKQSLYPASFIGEQNFSIGSFSFVLPEEIAQEKTNAFELAEKYLNTPYLWGGKATNGIDCSGLVQSVFRMKGLNLPRDAYQQEEIGIEVDFDDIRNDDVAFFSNKNGKIIHVGILNENSAIIHSSGRVRVDALTKEGIWNEDYGKLTHSLKNIKRLL